jgi:hypothetical protein
MQERLRDKVSIEDVFPAADGLPEGIKESELSTTYGGVGGAPYRKWLDEIERRLDQTPLLRSP